MCSYCLNQLSFIPGPVCQICAGLLDSIEPICQHCRDHKRPWQAASSSFLFQGLARQLIHRFKYQNDIALAKPLALIAFETLCEHKLSTHYDLIVPVPLHWLREFQRGYNQSSILAQELSKLTATGSKSILKRHRWTSPQASLSKGNRRRNLSKAFKVSSNIELTNKHVLLVDDVMTTGSTLEICTKLLRKSGAESVTVLTIAIR